jgi:YVTN family beta-propeller protein
VTNQIYVANGGSNTVTMIDGATNTTATVTVGSLPYDLAVNPVSDQIYVPGFDSNNVTVINGATNITTTVNIGTNPVGAVINPVTDKIYVPNYNSSNVTVIDGAANAPTTMSAQPNPVAVAVNPVTDQIYVANETSGIVTVIDGATDATTTVSVGTDPVAVAINPVTNQIYVVNSGSNNVTVIDGATNATATVNVGSAPQTVAVNPVTNQIYVLNCNSPCSGSGGPLGTVTVIDGATNATTTVGVQADPGAVAVNPVTNQIYVANFYSGSVTVINGANNSTTSVGVGYAPVAVAVNPVTNQIYVANCSTGCGDDGSPSVTVINGATNATTTINLSSSGPDAVAVNSITNKIYVANMNGTVTVIDGVTNATTNINVGTNPIAVAVNPVSNKIYVADNTYGDFTFTVIDGATNSTSHVPTGSSPIAVAVNPVTNEIYVADNGDNTITIIDEQQVQPIPLEANITALAGNVTSSSTPAFNFTAESLFAPFAPNPDNLLYQVDTWQGPWTAATAQGNGAFTGRTVALQPGVHILYAYATDGQDATSTMDSAQHGGNSPVISNIAAYPVLVSPPSATLSAGALAFGNQIIDTTSVSLDVTLTNNGGGPLTITSIAASGDYLALDNCPATLAAGASCIIGVSFTPSIVGTDNGILTVTDDNLGTAGTAQTVALTGTGSAVTTVSVTPASVGFGTEPLQISSTSKVVTVKNTGTGQLNISQIVITGADPGDFAQTNTCSNSIAPEKSCTVTVTFTPLATGARSASLRFTDDAKGSPQTVTLTGTGVVQAVLSPTSLTFAAEKVGTTSAAKTVTLTNNLATALALNSITFSGADSGDFSQTDTCGGSVPSKSHCTISVKFSPKATGTRTGTMNVNDGANNSPQTVSLTGTGQ